MSRRKIIDMYTWKEIVDKICKESLLDTPDFRKWIKSKEYLKGTFFDSKTWRNAYAIYKKIRTNNDHIEAIVGPERWGKSTLAVQKAVLVDPSFDTNRFIYNYDQLVKFFDKYMDTSAGKAAIIDEGYRLFASGDTMTKDGKMMMKLLSQSGQSNTYIIIPITQYEKVNQYMYSRIEQVTKLRRARATFTSYQKKGPKIIAECMIKKRIKLENVLVPTKYLYNGYWNSQWPDTPNITKEQYMNLKHNDWVDFINSEKQRLDHLSKRNQGVESSVGVITPQNLANGDIKDPLNLLQG